MVIAGKVLSRVAELVTEVGVFLREHGSVELATLFDDNKFQLKVFYLADIFNLLNEFSYSLQEKTNLRQRLQRRSPLSKRSYPYGKSEQKTRILLFFYCWPVKLVIRRD